MSATDGVTLYRKVMVPASIGPGGEPIVLTARQGKDRFYTILDHPYEGELLIDFDRDRQAVIERAVTMAEWHWTDVLARGKEIKRVMTVGFMTVGFAP